MIPRSKDLEIDAVSLYKDRESKKEKKNTHEEKQFAEKRRHGSFFQQQFFWNCSRNGG